MIVFVQGLTEARFKSITTFLDEIRLNIYATFRFGFKPWHGDETALLKEFLITVSVRGGKPCSSCAFKPRRSLDTVDNKILSSHCANRAAFKGKALKWLESYLAVAHTLRLSRHSSSGIPRTPSFPSVCCPWAPFARNIIFPFVALMAIFRSAYFKENCPKNSISEPVKLLCLAH